MFVRLQLFGQRRENFRNIQRQSDVAHRSSRLLDRVRDTTRRRDALENGLQRALLVSVLPVGRRGRLVDRLDAVGVRVVQILRRVLLRKIQKIRI